MKGEQFSISFREFSNECRNKKLPNLSASFLLHELIGVCRALIFLFAIHTEPSEGSVSSMYVYSVIVCKLLIHSIIYACVQCVTPLNSLADS